MKDLNYFVYFGVGFFVGMIIFMIFWNSCPEVVVSKNLIGDRINSCEAKGGRYQTYYSDFNERYVESCEIPKQEIKEF